MELFSFQLPSSGNMGLFSSGFVPVLNVRILLRHGDRILSIKFLQNPIVPGPFDPVLLMMVEEL